MAGPLLTKATETAVETIAKKAVESVFTRAAKKIVVFCKVYFNPLATHFRDYFKRACEKYDCANTLAFRNEGRRLRDIYQPLTLVRDNKRPNEEVSEFKIDKFPIDLFSTRKKVLITDTAGMGKSTLLKFLFLAAQEEERGIPILVELRNLSQEHGIIDEIRQQLRSLTEEFDEALLRALFKRWEGNFIFLFDGYDEIAQSQRDAVTADLKLFIESVGDNTFVLTSRPDYALTSFGDFVSYKIRPLTVDESYQLLRKYDSNGEISAKLVERLKSENDKRISDFLQNPLLTSLLFIGYNYKAEIPMEVHQFYYQVYEALFFTHDKSKGVGFVREKQSGCSCDEFASFLRAFAYVCFTEIANSSFPAADFSEYIKKAQSLSGVTQCDVRQLRDDMLYAVPLFQEEGAWVRWVHKSFMEYFAAAYLRWDHPDKENYLQELVDSKDITNSIVMLDFYADMDVPTFKKIAVLPVLKEFVAFMEERPVDETDPEQVQRILRRRQLLFHRETYLYLFDLGSKDFSFQQMSEIIEKEKPAGSAPPLWHNWGNRMWMISMSVCDSRFDLMQLILVHYPMLIIRYRWREDSEPFINHIPLSKLHHYTEDFMLDFPDNYDRLDSLNLEGTRVMGRDFIPDYEEAKNMLREMVV